MIAPTEKKIYTADEYLDLEVASDIRSEYRNGTIVPMTGGTPEHNDIASNLVTALKRSLRGRPYRVFILNQRLWLPAVNLYTYPDIMVLPKPIELQTGRRDTVMNACLIAEVLSKSTQNYDRGDQFVAYRTMPNFQEYVLIDQALILVEHHVKTAANQWLLTECDDPAASLTLPTLNVQISIADLYEDIDFVASNLGGLASDQEV